jgi:cytochrome bd-type quinol oxidase subunit 2
MGMSTIETHTTNDNHRRNGRTATWINWILAALTVPAAAAVMFFAMGQVMATAACSSEACHGPSGSAFGVMFYGVPVIPVVVLIASLVTAKRRFGIVVPVAGLVLLAVDAVILAGAFR